MTYRRGHTLVEMLVVIATASTVLTLSAMLIHRTMEMASKTRAFHAEEATAWRLSAQLRSDAAGAASIDLTADETGTTVALKNAEASPVVYLFSGPNVERTQRLNDGSKARELFEFPSIAGWKAESIDKAHAIRIDALPSPPPTRSPSQISLSLLVRAAGGSSL